MACTLEPATHADKPLLVVSVGAHVLALPGTVDAWHPKCPTHEPRMPFSARTEAPDGVLEVSLERSPFAGENPFDESKHLRLVLTAIAHRATANGYEAPGISELRQDDGHIATLLQLNKTAPNDQAWSLHGYAARPLSSGEVLLAHVSWTSFKSEEHASDPALIMSMLAMFGERRELFQE